MMESLNKTPQNLSNKQQNTRSQIATNEVYWNHVDEVIKEICCVSQQKQADKTSISHEQLQAIIADQSYRKMCARWSPQIFTSKLNQKQVDISQEFLLR
jgi:hypothetical protein